MTNQVTIKEVAARDGLQAQSVEISLDQRRELILSLVAAGVPELEIGSFVSPKAVPSNGRDGRIGANASRGNDEVQCARPQYEGLRVGTARGHRPIGDRCFCN